MRILHVSDLHFRINHFKWVASNAPKFDVTVISGDLLDLFSADKVSLAQQVKEVVSAMNSIHGKLFLCSGNHDWWENYGTEEAHAPGAAWMEKLRREDLVLDGATETVDGYEFACKPWVGSAPSFGGATPVILVAHAPPEGSAVSTGPDGDFGDFDTAEMARTLPRGSFILSGHAHRPRSWHDLKGGVHFFNPGVGKASSEAPNHIIIDTTKKMAHGRSSSGAFDPVRL